MITNLDVSYNARNPNAPLIPFVAFKNSASNIRIKGIPNQIGRWKITNVIISVTYPDSNIINVDCVRVNDTWIGTMTGTAIDGTVENGFKIVANGIDENGNEVNGYVLGNGDVLIIDDLGETTKGRNAALVHYLPISSDVYFNGDLKFENEKLKIRYNNQWQDFGYLSEHQSLSDYWTSSETSSVISIAIDPKRDYVDLSYTIQETDWICSPQLPDGYSISFEEITEEIKGWYIINGGMVVGGMASENSNATYLHWNLEISPFDYEVTATRTIGRNDRIVLSSELDSKLGDIEFALSVING